MLVLINRTMNTLCVIIKMGKLMTLNNNRLPFCHEKKNIIFIHLAEATTEGKQFAILE